jgi:histidine triad (HIT) family protein
MPLTDEQAKSIKEQLFKQIESFPEDKRAGIKSYIESLDNEKLEEFLIKNKLIRSPNESGESAENTNEESSESPAEPTPGKQECVMCMLANKKIESLAIYEDKDYLAALEINPFSPGHIILIPKSHIKESKALKSKAFTIANKIGKHLVKNLKAENFQITSSDDVGHAIINIIPRYKDQKVSFERKPAKKQELQELAIKIGKLEAKQKSSGEKKEKSPSKKTGKDSVSSTNIIKLPRRIP